MISYFIIAKSPVLSHLSASIKGLTTIRANRVEYILSEQFDKYQVNKNIYLFI